MNYKTAYVRIDMFLFIDMKLTKYLRSVLVMIEAVYLQDLDQCWRISLAGVLSWSLLYIIVYMYIILYEIYKFIYHVNMLWYLLME